MLLNEQVHWELGKLRELDKALEQCARERHRCIHGPNLAERALTLAEAELERRLRAAVIRKGAANWSVDPEQIGAERHSDRLWHVHGCRRVPVPIPRAHLNFVRRQLQLYKRLEVTADGLLQHDSYGYYQEPSSRTHIRALKRLEAELLKRRAAYAVPTLEVVFDRCSRQVRMTGITELTAVVSDSPRQMAYWVAQLGIDRLRDTCLEANARPSLFAAEWGKLPLLAQHLVDAYVLWMEKP